MSTAVLDRPRGRHADSAPIPTPAACPLCAKKHQRDSAPARACATMIAQLTATESSAAKSGAAPTVDLDDVELTASDIERVLATRCAALVLCPWGGVMAVTLPYPGQEVVADHLDVWHWYVACDHNAERTAEALAVDLAWTASPAAMAAVAA